MAGKYKIKTMQKDINKITRKDSPADKTSAPPEKLPIEPPGEPIPREPIGMIKTPEPPKLTTDPPQPEKPIIAPRSRKTLAIIILSVIVLLIGGGFYYWWNYLRVPEKSELEIPAFLVGVDEIEIIELLEINIPTNVSNVLEEKYTFFLYAQKEGNRAGFVVKIIDREALVASLKDWEKIMEEDLRSIFLGQEPGEPVNEKFQDGTYQGINIRYLNFSELSLAIDYALAEDYLIITTSKESIFKMIERILE